MGCGVSKIQHTQPIHSNSRSTTQTPNQANVRVMSKEEQDLVDELEAFSGIMSNINESIKKLTEIRAKKAAIQAEMAVVQEKLAEVKNMQAKVENTQAKVESMQARIAAHNAKKTAHNGQTGN